MKRQRACSTRYMMRHSSAVTQSAGTATTISKRNKCYWQLTRQGGTTMSVVAESTIAAVLRAALFSGLSSSICSVNCSSKSASNCCATAPKAASAAAPAECKWYDMTALYAALVAAAMPDNVTPVSVSKARLFKIKHQTQSSQQ